MRNVAIYTRRITAISRLYLMRSVFNFKKYICLCLIMPVKKRDLNLVIQLFSLNITFSFARDLVIMSESPINQMLKN